LYGNVFETIMAEEITGNKKHFLGNTPKDRRNNIIVVFLALVLATLLVVFFMQRSDYRRIIGEMSAEKDSIQFELSQIIVSYDSLKTENDTINEQLYFAQTKVKDLLLEVEQTKRLSIERITRYQQEVTTLRDIMRNYIVQIDSLNRRNQKLMAENIEVKEQVRQVESQNLQLSQEKQRLEQNLQRAAQLETSDLTAVGVNNRDRETGAANRTTMIRVNFTLNRNISARRGAKNVYVRIMRPDQLLLSKSPDDLFQFEDLRIQYSAMREVNYEGNDLPIAIYWDNEGKPFMSGRYTIDVFADGNNIGTTTLDLK
jgi:FtsZ-binding cell division protein ZapB